MLRANSVHLIYRYIQKANRIRKWGALRLTTDGQHDKLSRPQSVSALEPIHKFGIVAAMSTNHVIGVNGSLPWKLPEERRIFENLTKNKILIIGRRTFEEEEGDLSHVRHCIHCIVVSRSLNKVGWNDCVYDPKQAPNTTIHLASSFTEAVGMARELEKELKSKGRNVHQSSNDISCWVAGGQTIYKEALVHSSASQLHLSVVDIDIQPKDESETAFFPAKEAWEKLFEERKTERHACFTDGADKVPTFTYHVYSKIQ